jgi:hypothetical protein
MDFDRWLEQPYDERAKASAAIEREIERILDEPAFNPSNVETFWEAIDGGVLANVSKDDFRKALESPEVGHNALGTLVFNAVYDWCYKQAENEAANRYNERIIHD